MLLRREGLLMSENQGTLRIHTQLRPEPPEGVRGRSGRNNPSRRPEKRRRRAAFRRSKPRSGERLLRNSAIACAVLLGILALGNIRQPWAEKAAESIERALTMHIDLDDSIGDLTFVRQIMPESALVFLNISKGPELTLPVDGELLHAWSEMQPWVMFGCAADAPVFADDAGTIAAVSELSDGQYGLLIDHGGGLESVYAGLKDVAVEPGDAVERGQSVGAAGEDLYFEFRSAGDSADPSERLGL